VTGSNDIPERNPLNYPLQSFDLSDDAVSSTNVQHIRSINDAGRNASLDDHTFVDGSGDVPFSVSFWIKQSSTSGVQYIVSKGANTSGRYEWNIYGAATSLTFRLYDAGGVSGGILQVQTIGSLSTNSWQHYVLTYDGSATINGINIYKNGNLLPLSRTTFGTYNGMSPSNLALCIGAEFTSTSYAVSQSTDLIGKLHSVAIWKNRVISSTEASALYNAYVNGPGGEARSGFISRSPRLMLRELDDLPGSYPTVRRTGDPTRTGQLVSSFNDTTSIIFSESENSVFPSMLPKSSRFRSQAVDITGQDSDISASLPIRSFQHPNHLHYSPTENVGPFDENRAMPATDFFLTGTDPDALPGFTSPLRSKLSVEIDLTSKSDFKLMRNYRSRTLIENPSSTEADRTGFAYYNHDENEWQDIGLIDQAGGSFAQHDFAFAYGPSYTPISGTDSFVMQFTPGGQIGGAVVNAFAPGTAPASVLTEDEIISTGLTKTGSPTIIARAPAATKYYASSSQRIRMSDFISSPILLEQVVLNLDEVQFQQTYESSTNTGNTGESVFSQSPVNVSFFIYRQHENSHTSNVSQRITGSIRSIVASGSAFFYNSNIYHTGYHGPSFSYDLSTPVSYDAVSYGMYTGSMQVIMTPAVAPEQSLGITTNILTSSIDVGDTQLYGALGHYWPGGTGYKNFTPSFRAQGGSDMTVWNYKKEGLYISPSSGLGSLIPRMVEPIFDSRAFRFIGSPENASGSDSNIAIQGVQGVYTEITNNPQSAFSPYILFPSDELIFGVDFGVSIPSYQGSGPVYSGPYNSAKLSVLTGTFMKIPAGKRAKLTLYGSMILNAQEKLHDLNQNLSSDSVHEIIGAESVVDQFQIEPVSSYYGSYLEEIIAGNMATPVLGGIFFVTASQDASRRVISRVSLGQAGSTGSLQRFTSLSDAKERTYDSCLPDPFALYHSGATVRAQGSEYQLPELVVPDLREIGGTTYSWLRTQFPFLNNPSRLSVISPFEIYDDRSGMGGYAYSSTLINGLQALYQVNFVGGYRGSDQPSYFGRAKAYRYGISSLRPEVTSISWRNDRYGQLRDMLEPRLGVASFNGKKTIRVKFMSGSSVVTDPSETHCQNISAFATSSMPYFDDGVARNRSDNPDETLLIVLS
jgi:hypothetical protein